MSQVAIVAAKRTAVGSFAGALASVSADELGATVIRQLLTDTGVAADQVSEVILGQVLTAGQGQNPARKATINAGLPETCPAMTINKVCGSGLKAVSLGVQAILLGDAEIVIAGGQENMSQSGHVLLGSRDGFRMGNASLIDTMLKDGLTMGSSSPSSRKAETRSLLNYGFRFFETQRSLNAGDVLSDARVWKGRSQQVSLGVLEDVVLTLPRSTANLTTEIIVDDPLIAPLAVGDVVGRVMLSRAGELVTEVPLQTLEAVESAGFFARLWDSIMLWFQQLLA